MRLNPLDPRGLGASRIGTAHALFFLGDYDEASSWAAMGLLTNPDAPGGLRFAAASDAMAGRLEQAHNAVARLRQAELDPTCFQSQEVLGPYRLAENISQYEEGLRRAGLPEWAR